MTHRKPARISPDSRPIAYGAAGLAAAIYCGAFATSFAGQAALASYMLIPQQLQYVVPAVVDLAMVLFTVATLLRRHRGESTLITNLATAFWVATSIAANVSHILIPAGPQATWTSGTYAGAALSALMPLAALGASLVLENVLIEERPAAVQPPEEVVQPVATKPEPVKVAQELAVGRPIETVPAAPRIPVEPRAVAPVQNIRPRTAQPASDGWPTVDWKLLAGPERRDLIRSYREEGDNKLTWPQISAKLKISESTAKRIEKDAEPQLEAA